MVYSRHGASRTTQKLRVSLKRKSSPLLLGYRVTHWQATLFPEPAAPEKSGLQVKVKEKVAATAPYSGLDVPLFLLALIDKGERANLSKAERNTIAQELASQDYRSGVRVKVAHLKWRR